MAKELSQPEQRRGRRFTDQHGREWQAQVDIRTGHAAGPWEPLFKAPWYPDAKYIKHDRKDDRRIVIDYVSCIRDRKDADWRYDEYLRETAMKMYGSAFSKMTDDPPPDLIAKVGPRPFSYEFPEAAQEGNKWVLGLSDKVPQWAEKWVRAQENPRRKYLDADEAADLDEQFDPEALGGKRVKVEKPKRKGYYELLNEEKAKGTPLPTIHKMWREMKAQWATEDAKAREPVGV